MIVRMRKYSPVTESPPFAICAAARPDPRDRRGCRAFAVLGRWQLDRAEEKRALARSIHGGGPGDRTGRGCQPIAPRYQRVIAQRPLRHRTTSSCSTTAVTRGVAGVEVLTPFVLDGGGTVLVNRGWQPFGATRQDLPDVAVDDGPRTIAGKIDELPRPGIRLPAPPATGWPRLVQYPRHGGASAAARRASLHPRAILLDPAEPDGYVARLASARRGGRPESRLRGPVVRVRRARGARSGSRSACGSPEKRNEPGSSDRRPRPPAIPAGRLAFLRAARGGDRGSISPPAGGPRSARTAS